MSRSRSPSWGSGGRITYTTICIGCLLGIPLSWTEGSILFCLVHGHRGVIIEFRYTPRSVCPTMRSAYIALLPVALAFGQSETTLDKGIEEFHKGQYSEAQQDFEKTLKLSPADARAITYLAVTRATLGDCAGSIDELKLQCHRNPDPEIRKLAGLAVIQCLLPHNQLGEIMPLME